MAPINRLRASIMRGLARLMFCLGDALIRLGDRCATRGERRP